MNALNRDEFDSINNLQRLLSALSALFWVVAIVLLISQTNDTPRKRPLGLLIVAAIFFGLSLGLFIVDLLPRLIALVLIGVDLGSLGFAVARLNAFDEGESLLPDFIRSLVASMLEAAVFGVAVAVAASFIGFTPPMVALLFAVIALAIGSQVFAPQWQSALDRLTLSPRLQQTRIELREVAEALPRSNNLCSSNNSSPIASRPRRGWTCWSRCLCSGFGCCAKEAGWGCVTCGCSSC